MLDTSSWQEIELDVLTEIHLDPKNVRLETASAQVEADIMEDLFANEDALGLVDGISKVGYLTHEIPVVVKRRGKFVVVEGNRRIAALKAIQNPQLVPDFQARINRLVADIPDRDRLRRIRAKVAPNQDQADQLIAALHTGNLRRSWTPARQAAFFQAQIDSGRTFKQLVLRYPTIDVRKFVFRSHMVNKFRNANYAEAETRDYLNSKGWRRGLSTLARIYESKEFLELTGFTMDATGKLGQEISDSTFDAMAGLIVEGMRLNEINTRTLNTVRAPRFAKLMSELRELKNEGQDDTPEQPRSEGTGTRKGGAEARNSGTRAGGNQEPHEPAAKDLAETGTGQAAPARPVRKAKPRFIDLGQFHIPEVYPTPVHLGFQELSVLDVQRLPNATYTFLRAILEKSIKAYAEAKDIDIRKAGHHNGGRVQLFNCLSWLEEHFKANGPVALVQPVQKLKSGRFLTYTNSGDSLNAVNHNHHFMVDPDEVFSFWHSIDSIMRELMKP